MSMHTEEGYLFPFFVCRVSGLPVDCIAALHARECAHFINQLITIEARLEQAKEHVSQCLYTAIGQVEQKPQRMALIQLRRDLYNLRSVDAVALTSALSGLSTPTMQDVQAFFQLMETRQCLLRDLKRSYWKEIQTARQQFQTYLQDEDFQKGLLLSSHSLYKAQQRYWGVAKANLSGKKEKIERGLLRYFSRAAMKATPFGTFCAILPGTFTANEAATKPLYTFDRDPSVKKSLIRLNKRLYGILRYHLQKRAAVRKYLHVERNPTIRDVDDQLLFLSIAEGQEVFQRLAKNPVLSLISDALQQQGAVPLGALLDTLTSHPELETSKNEALTYLDRLLEIGFLRFRTGISEQEVDWDLPFRDLLEHIEDPYAQAAAALLQALRKKMEAFETATAAERAVLLHAMQEQMRTTFETMEIKSRLPIGLPFFEDATANATAEIVAHDDITQISNTLLRYGTLTACLAWPRPEQVTMRHFFDTYYGAHGATVPLLQFYEDYYREHFKAHLEKQQIATIGKDKEKLEGYNLSNPFGLQLIDEIHRARKHMTDLVAARWAEAPEAQEINLTAEDLKEILRDLPPPAATCRSVSLFAQLIPSTQANEPTRLIFPGGSYSAGYGKYFSRFLHLFPDQVQAELYAANQTLTDHHLAEICGDANFNGNLHPPLLSWEISYPTGESGQADKQILSSEVLVEPDPEDPHALRLRHACTNKRVLPIDLGFLNPRMRPPLHQLLTRFTPVVGFSLTLPTAPSAALPASSHVSAAATNGEPPNAEKASEDHHESGITYQPRIVYEHQLVLSRKNWSLPLTLFPVRQANESAFAYFVRINRWRHQYNLPDEVYVRILPTPQVMGHPNETERMEETHAEEIVSPEQASEEHMQSQTRNRKKQQPKVSRDLRKPQYIDFNNPQLVILLGKMIRNVESYTVIFEERYPAAESLPRYDGQAYTTELILQLNYPATAQTTATPEQKDATYATY